MKLVLNSANNNYDIGDKTKNITLELAKMIFENQNPAELLAKMIEFIKQTTECKDFIFIEDAEKTFDINEDLFEKSVVLNHTDFEKVIFSIDNRLYDVLTAKHEIEKFKNNINDCIVMPLSGEHDLNNLVPVKLYHNEIVWGILLLVNCSCSDITEKDNLFLFDVLFYFTNICLGIFISKKMIKNMAYLDMLTTIQNRKKYIRDLKKLREEGTITSFGVIYIDVNSLKEINDENGHAFGDFILIKVARILRKFFDEREVYRIGGDEFIILIPQISAQSFDNIILELRNRFLITSDYTVSMGYKFSDNIAGGFDFDKMINDATEMMYKDKKDYYRLNPPTTRYRYTIDSVFGLADENYLLSEIRDKRFLVYLQPKYKVRTGGVIGAEALVRYLDKDDAIIVPNQFIPSLEKAKLINYLDFYVFEEVCKCLKRWLKMGKEIFPVSVNFSRFTLLEHDFSNKLNAIWEKYNFPKDCLELEITESVGSVGAYNMYKTLNQLRESGFTLSIDDFGMEYANLALFAHIDFDVLKIDRSLLSNIKSNKKAILLIKSLVNVCESMNIKLIVEGVESEEQLEIIKSVGCFGVQGYLFNKPMPIEDFENKVLGIESEED